jgi:hypothetical protein
VSGARGIRHHDLRRAGLVHQHAAEGHGDLGGQRADVGVDARVGADQLVVRPGRRGHGDGEPSEQECDEADENRTERVNSV